MRTLTRTLTPLFVFAAGAIVTGCTTENAVAPAASASFARAGSDEPGVHRQYGTPTKVGDGKARTYVVLDAKAGNTPLEVGIALDATALQGLPDDNAEHSYVLPMPAHGPSPYQFAELDWNPHGHSPLGIYGIPHFDFHFYTISREEWSTIAPGPTFATRANNLPTGNYVAPMYLVPGPPALVAVPYMGVHWINPTSPEFNGQVFTKTFIYGSWNGRYIFYEPMITRAYLLSQPNDVVTSIPTPALRPLDGYYPSAYRVTYDAQAKEYRVALTQLSYSQAGAP